MTHWKCLRCRHVWRGDYLTRCPNCHGRNDPPPASRWPRILNILAWTIITLVVAWLLYDIIAAFLN